MTHENREFIVRSLREALLAGTLVALSVFVEKLFMLREETTKGGQKNEK